jgi:Prokaryotic glutathione synthetase, ATP-grasp domain
LSAKILVITNSNDPHSDEVIKKVKNTNILFRVNTDDLLGGFCYHVEVSENKSESYFENPLGGRLLLKDVGCIYYRRPEKPSSLENESRNISKVVIDEAWHGLFHTLYDNLDCQWLGHPFRDRQNSSRIRQLRMAQEIGWRIPPTLVSRNVNAIRSFCNEFPEVVIKPIGEKGVEVDGMWYPYFTSKVDSQELLKLSAQEIGITYNYMQSYIPKENEWRITVVGDKVFPCIINSQTIDESKVDWRLVDYQVIKHERGVISKRFERQLIEYLRRMKMPFGAFDFILTPNGEFVFLECNPNGQWLWIEELTGMDISGAIANWLETKI